MNMERDDAERERWLPGVELELRTVRENRSVRALWPDGTPVDFGFIDKGQAKSALNVQHRKLPDEETREQRKAFWGERLEALAELLAPGG